MYECLLIDARSGGAIGAGLFISSGTAFQSGGPGSVLVGFILVGELYSATTATRQLTHFQVSWCMSE